MKRWGFIIFLSLLWFTSEALATSPLVKPVQDLIKKVDNRYSRIEDLQADFSQETKIEGFQTSLSSAGRLYLKKPGLLRWDYHHPSVEQIFVNGDQLEVYVPEHKQVVKGNLTHMAASKAPLALLQGVGKLADEFDVMPTGEGELGVGGLPLLTLIPRITEEGSSTMKQIVLEIEPTTYLIKTIILYEISGNISTLRFTNINVNQGITSTLLKLEVPDDVVVVDAPMIQ
jgi:outer membrane lipoprotein carrier protein